MATRKSPMTIIEQDLPQQDQTPDTPVKITPRLRMLKDILANMMTPTKYRFLLTGDTGLGKTTLVQQLAKLLGMNLELLEIPHATEEHLIQLPFLVFKASGGEETGTLTVKKDSKDNVNDVDIELARSHLSAKLRSFRPLPDAQYISQQQGWNAADRMAYEAIGGVIGKITHQIALARSKWHSIMFFDEYWRTTTPQIRNVLRDILNGMIGNDTFPEKVYVIYASNMIDVGGTIEKPSQNARMLKAPMPSPTAEELLNYLESKHKFKPELLAAVRDVLMDEHVSYNDENTEIRTSPRRWEQVLLYINANIPPRDRDDAEALMANLKHMMSNEHNESSQLWPLVEKVARRIIKASGSVHHDVKPAESGDWRKTLDQQIATKIKLGTARKYIPVLSGPPGIAKTQAMRDIAKKNNLVLVHISSPTLDSDSISGLPIPRRERSVTEAATTERLGVQFAEPVLYKSIMQRAEDATQAFLRNKSPEEKVAWERQPFKYLLFFDEINRVKDSRTFNALRRVLLDRKFGDGRKVPDDMLITAAMNPSDSKTLKLTSHVKDAIDIIGSSPSWRDTKEYIERDSDLVDKENIGHVPEDLRDIAKKLVFSFADTFGMPTSDTRNDITNDSRHFYIGISPDSDPIYVSPRDYDDMYKGIVSLLYGEMDDLSTKPEERNTQMAEVAYRAIEHELGLILDHAGIGDAPQFMSSIRQWLDHIMPEMTTASSQTATMDIMLKAILADRSRHLADDRNFRNYIREFDRTAYEEEITRLMDDLMEAEVNKYDLWAKNQVDARKREQGKMVVIDELWSKLKAVHAEVVDTVKDLNLTDEMVDAMDVVIGRTLRKIAKSVKLPEENRKELLKKAVDMLHSLEVAGGK